MAKSKKQKQKEAASKKPQARPKHKSVWFEAMLPKSVHPYAYIMRLDRPIGVWLLLFPGLWAIVLASGGIFNMNAYGWFVCLLFCIGAVIMRGAGCIINDIWDRDIDKNVARTKSRPLAAGTLTPQNALIFMAVLLAVGFVILLQLPFLAVILGLISLPLIIAYPFMKRLTFWPQAFLGVTFNFGVLIGWAAITGGLSGAAFLLYFGCIAWTIGYDTIYAYQDKEDDSMLGIKSTALLFGDLGKTYVSLFYAFFGFCLFVVFYTGIEDTIQLFLIVPALAHLGWQISDWNMLSHRSSLAVFKSNRDLGALILLAFAFVSF